MLRPPKVLRRKQHARRKVAGSKTGGSTDVEGSQEARFFPSRPARDTPPVSAVLELGGSIESAKSTKDHERDSISPSRYVMPPGHDHDESAIAPDDAWESCPKEELSFQRVAPTTVSKAKSQQPSLLSLQLKGAGERSQTDNPPQGDEASKPPQHKSERPNVMLAEVSICKTGSPASQLMGAEGPYPYGSPGPDILETGSSERSRQWSNPKNHFPVSRT